MVYMRAPGDYAGHIVFFFENGKAARVELSGYATKTNRRKLTAAYSDKSPLRSIVVLREETELAAYSRDGRCLVVNSALLAPKSTRSTQGVQFMTLKKRSALDRALRCGDVRKERTALQNEIHSRGRRAAAEEDMEEKQLTLDGMGE